MLMQYTQLQKNAQEISNLKKAAEVMDADTELKGTQSLKNISESAKTDQDRQFFRMYMPRKSLRSVPTLGLRMLVLKMSKLQLRRYLMKSIKSGRIYYFPNKRHVNQNNVFWNRNPVFTKLLKKFRNLSNE